MTKTVMFNPYTGTPRHPSDLSSDPEGLLILEPEAPLLAAQPARSPLTDDRLRDIADDFKDTYVHGGTTFDVFDAVGFARAVEAALGVTPA